MWFSHALWAVHCPRILLVWRSGFQVLMGDQEFTDSGPPGSIKHQIQIADPVQASHRPCCSTNGCHR
jgi:hypothetical protein